MIARPKSEDGEPVGFRAKVRAWLDAHCPPAMRKVPLENERCWGGRSWVFSSDEQRAWLTAMVHKGWTAPEWPQEFGGAGLTREDADIVRQEMARLGCRSPLDSLGIWMLGPALLKFGTPEQKVQHLGAIARGEIRWCQGYSEPEAGSDLVSLRTRAEDRGDHFVVNGRKIWTSHGHRSDWIFFLARTNPEVPKHGGISFLLADMSSSGISARPINLISGHSNFAEVLFENVVVPKNQLVGTLHGGWEVANYLLGHERNSIAATKSLPADGTLGRMAHAASGTGEGALENPVLRADIAAFEIRALALAAMQERLADLAAAGSAIGVGPSILKYASSELNKDYQQLRTDVLGYPALEWDSDRSQHGHDARTWLRSKGNSIEGGTSEIQLNIIAKRELGLKGS
jgi:acyl-CoA dehydrogenase